MSSRFAPWLLCIASVCPASLDAQTATTGSISGYVYDQQRGVLAGVTITAISADVPGTRQTTSTTNGAYRLTDLPPGMYTLTAEHSGFARFTQADIRIGAGLNLGLEIVLTVADVNETVEVRHAPPMLEVLRPGQTNNISGELQRAVPLNRNYEWAQAMELIPGATISAQSVGQLYSFHGSGLGGHVMLLDGADAMPASSASNGLTNLGINAVADVQVSTAITDASVPLGIGAVMNVVTKSGSNDWKGTASLVYQPRRWNDANIPGGSSEISSLVQPDVALGGPIIRDRMWAFGSYQYRRAATGIARSPETLSNLVAANPAFRPFDNTNRASYVLGKFTNRLKQAELALSAQYDRNPSYSDGASAATLLSQRITGGSLLSGRVSWTLRPSLQATFASSYNNKSLSREFANAAQPSRNVYTSVIQSGARLQGVGLLGTLNNSGIVSPWPGSKLTAAADLSYVREAYGAHNLQFGAYFERDRDQERRQLSNGGLFQVDEILRNPGNPAEGTVVFHQASGSPEILWNRDDRVRNLAAYIQDMWKPHRRVTVAAGVRVDSVSRRDLLFDSGNQDSVEIGPRLGATVSLDSASRYIVHAAVGRIHNALSTFRVSGLLTTAFTVEDRYDMNRDGIFDTTITTPGASRISPNRRVDPALRQPYTTDLTTGYRQQIGNATAVDVTWLRREFRREITAVEINAIYENSVFIGLRDETQNEIRLITNNQWNWRNHSELTVQLSHRAARTQLVTSYARQTQRLEGAWEPNEPTGILQPDAFPNRGANPEKWRDHTFRMGGTIMLPAETRVAANYVVQSGRWSDPITTLIAAPDPAFGPPSLVIGGRVVSNPLATRTRFGYPTRGDGLLRSDPFATLDVTAAKQLRIATASVEVAASVFNLLNSSNPQLFLDTNLISSNFGRPIVYQSPRAGQIVVRLAF